MTDDNDTFNWTCRNIGEYPQITDTMMMVLHRLQQLPRGYFMPLPDTHGRTLSSLQQKDLIVKSVSKYDPGDVQYRITHRGRGVYDVYKKPPGHDLPDDDTLCRDCGTRKRHITKSGRVRAYCKPCRRKRSARYREARNHRNLKAVQAGKVLLCYRCKKRPRWVTGQTVQDYCEQCQKAFHKEWRDRQK